MQQGKIRCCKHSAVSIPQRLSQDFTVRALEYCEKKTSLGVERGMVILVLDSVNPTLRNITSRSYRSFLSKQFVYRRCSNRRVRIARP